jgi:hypothetical protein
MARYKPQDHNSLLLPVVLSVQIVPGSFAFALNYLVDHELDLAPLDAQFKPARAMSSSSPSAGTASPATPTSPSLLPTWAPRSNPCSAKC